MHYSCEVESAFPVSTALFSSSSTIKLFTVALLVFAATLALTSAQGGCSGGTQCTGGCCPDSNAVCCPSGKACCPHATTCGKVQGLCIPGINRFMMKLGA